MNLIIDVGNTYTKLGVFEASKIIYKNTIKQHDFRQVIQKIKEEYPLITDAIVSSVSDIKEDHVTYVKNLFNTIVLDHLVEMPFANHYKTPTTLGIDRLALVAAAVDQFPNRDVLVIDAGTCITYDFKNKKEEYLGGAIGPGVRLRYESLHNYTAKLPLLKVTDPKNHIGNSTEEAIHSGVVFGILHEINGVIEEYCNIYTDLTVILTGGDAHFLSKRLKNSIFATSNFLLEGLNHILAFNNSK
ncbi:type III pantothenate kinase [Aquimarina sp. MAR_2010_214]|uniref:type III pantothenate kinase n=1 Tax=Aquimarina sp. MAR_2010_214 TaxID=1250026 RepID=UPI000C70EAD1|nr:type III pantothenate kinase [Aquimarina sp. MAR_2010_214]PKV48132.1 type III pantothenate kinase [Aquimarina sp. MAR_2010_214]